MVAYQPTPARHIFELIDAAELTAEDVLVDVGSGLGHVPLVISICTPGRCIGIECESAYVEQAWRCSERLNLHRVEFVQRDAREADLSAGTVFYLYTPFTGSILRAVLDRLRRHALVRPIRVCSYGPCTPELAQEPWLEAMSPATTDRVAVFCSRTGD
jgi:tRNA A58 N-methylase Trm61